MNAKERRGWLVVVALFVTLFLVFGSGYNTAGVFFTPVLQYFGWSRTRLSSLQTALAVTAGLSVPVVGWLLDRVEARSVIGVGITLAAGGFLLAGQAHTFRAMLAAYVLLGLGIGTATLLPCSLVVANWFCEQRGRALGLTMAGTTVGGMVMTLVADRIIAWGGWRAAYTILAVPMLLIALPLVLLLVRTRPPEAVRLGVEGASGELPGLGVAEALRARSFWIIAAAQFCFAFAVTGAGLHTIPYLIVIGYAPSSAALVLSLTMGLAAVGKIVMGFAAERAGSRPVLAADLILIALGQIVLLGARNRVMLLCYTAIYGLASGAPLALIPMLLAESLGLRRFGSLSGLAGVFTTIGAATGPLVAGLLFDASSSYRTAFEMFAFSLILGGCAVLACVPLSSTEAQPSSRNPKSIQLS